jgi:hypothetical protein
VNELVEGKVQVGFEAEIKDRSFNRTYKPSFNERGEAGAFGYTPKKMSGRTTEWARKLKTYMLNQKTKRQQRSWNYDTRKAEDDIIDLEKWSNKAGRFALEFVDFFDEICDKISIATTFVDGFLYDPDNTSLDWYPLSEKALDQVAQESVRLQLQEFKIFNDSLDPSEIKRTYPLIAGPLDLLDQNAPAGQNSKDDPEYAQRRYEYELDAIRAKIMNDPNRPYRQTIINAEFDGNEADLVEYLADTKNSILDYDGDLSPTDYDSVYLYAFTEVCTYHGGKTYVDTYTDKDGNTNRKKPMCGWPDKATCIARAKEWINTQGAVGTYGEWFTWKQLTAAKDQDGFDGIFTRLKKADPNFVAPITTDSPFYKNNDLTTGACIVTGAGQHFSCKDAGGIYDPGEHRCGFTEKICQYYGTCYNPANRNCEMPPGIEHVQNFFGSYLPREWIRIYGCLKGPNPTARFTEVWGDVGNFLTGGGNRLITDIGKNKKNWSAGMKAIFSDTNTIINLVTIFGPALLGLGTGPSMLVIAVVIGGQMADQALQQNRDIAQMPPSVPAEYTVGGWKSDQTSLPRPNFRELKTLTSVIVPGGSSQGFFLEVVANITIETKQPHGFAVGDTLSHKGMDDTTKFNFRMWNPATNSALVSLTVSQVLSTTKFVMSGVHCFVDPLDPLPKYKGTGDISSVYVRRGTTATKPVYTLVDFTVTEKTKDNTGKPRVKQNITVGFVKGWVTKPLRPKKANGSPVEVTEGVDQIAGVVEQPFYIDVRPAQNSVDQVILPSGCNDDEYGKNTITSSCVNRTIGANKRIADGFDGNALDGAHVYRCLAKGLSGWVWAFEDKCKMATAVDAATGFIQNDIATKAPREATMWGHFQKFKRLCSERDTYNQGDPMIRAWDAPHANKVWCLPEVPPDEWADSRIGSLNFAETQYSRYKAWTSGVDPNSPDVHNVVMSEGGNEQAGDSAKYWYYQLVYDPEAFNRQVLWDDALLSNNFSAYTISDMRKYYCEKDFKALHESDQLVDLDDRCWGYMALFTAGYSFIPMTVPGYTYAATIGTPVPLNWVA